MKVYKDWEISGCDIHLIPFVTISIIFFKELNTFRLLSFVKSGILVSGIHFNKARRPHFKNLKWRKKRSRSKKKIEII